MNMKSIVTRVQMYLEDKKKVNPFGYSIFETNSDLRTSRKEMFEDMTSLYRKDDSFLLNHLAFYKAISLLNALRNTFRYKSLLSETVFGDILDYNYIDPTDVDNIPVMEALKRIYATLQRIIYSPGYIHLDEIHAWRVFGFELLYENSYNHSVLVIPYQDESGYTHISRMIIHTTDPQDV